ncbi:SDR family NAD(P)-dependent oxidoreductase [Nocardia sp. 348MFTsu5.1]|uniref:SDR family NAD(P)-dependent oxidoreductase n=1 Tax=Nocardia sp. 348MFTsu5.1 TaxID=1172185 RepID=UPI0003814618|nr:glucose 1-dehydrogenase [Nocardia sp. 348MFTsu5.1]
MTTNLSGKTALVTGGSRGLGLEIARAYALSGADVVIASRKADVCAAVAADLAKETGRDIVGLGCHVGRWADCDRLVDDVYERFGRIDILVNNAGMSPTYPSLTDVSEELFDKVMAVNIKGPFRLATLIGTRMVKHGGGSIINISSIAAVQPGDGEVPYAIAKAGVNNLSSALAHALSPTVRVNTIMPGLFLTDISKAWDPATLADMTRTKIPLQRAGNAEEITGAALYLAGDDSSYTTGSVIKVDGGVAWAAG